MGAGAGYAVCVVFLDEILVRRWSDERKAAARRRNLERRVNRIALLFAEELIEREMEHARLFSRKISAIMQHTWSVSVRVRYNGDGA